MTINASPHIEQLGLIGANSSVVQKIEIEVAFFACKNEKRRRCVSKITEGASKKQQNFYAIEPVPKVR